MLIKPLDLLTSLFNFPKYLSPDLRTNHSSSGPNSLSLKFESYGSIAEFNLDCLKCVVIFVYVVNLCHFSVSLHLVMLNYEWWNVNCCWKYEWFWIILLLKFWFMTWNWKCSLIMMHKRIEFYLPIRSVYNSGTKRKWSWGQFGS